jgi:hypothetical protein
MNSTLQKNIMRRVYYSYAVSVATSPILWQGILLAICVMALGRLTHVAAIAHNMGATKLAQLPTYITNSFMHALHNGEVLTVLVVLFIVGLSAKLFYRAIHLFTRSNKLKAA